MFIPCTQASEDYNKYGTDKQANIKLYVRLFFQVMRPNYLSFTSVVDSMNLIVNNIFLCRYSFLLPQLIVNVKKKMI